MANIPDDAMPSDKRAHMASDCFKRGTEAMSKKNWDYAISMYRQAASLVPSNVLFRQTLRGCEEKKYGDNGKGASMASMKLMTVRGRLSKARYSKDWQSINQIAEDGLAVNPWDHSLNAALGEAAKNLGWFEVAVYAYERAVKFERLNKDYNRELAQLLEDRGEFERAIEAWSRVLEADKLDSQARMKITQLEAKKTLVRGRYEDASSTRDLMDDQRVAQIMKTGEKTDGPGQSPEEDLRRAIRKDPANKDNYLKLADFLSRNGNLDEAEETLKQAFEVSGGDINIRERLDEVQLDRMRTAVEFARQKAAKPDADQQARDQYASLQRELLHREIEIFSNLVERYPADSRRKFDLAGRFMKIDKLDQAIPLFQQARTDMRLKGQALLNLGKCFASKKEYTLAKRQLEQAVPEIKLADHQDQYLELYYFLGRVNEKLRDKEAAIQNYQEVLAVNYAYKDTRARIEALEASGQDQ